MCELMLIQGETFFSAQRADLSTVYDSPVQRQPVIEESSIEGHVPVLVEPANKPLAFEIVEGGSERGKRKIIDSWGYSYNVKR